MNWTKILEFFKGILTEDDGKPSSARVRAVGWDAVCTIVVLAVFWHLIHVTDSTELGVWLSHLPFLIFALICLTNAGYLINQCGSVISDLASMLGKGSIKGSQDPDPANSKSN